MIKGISKQIIEIKCPNNEYFEKALLFVNSKNQMYPTKLLNEQAKIFASRLDGSDPAQVKRRKGLSESDAAKIICIVMLGSLAVALIILGLLL